MLSKYVLITSTNFVKQIVTKLKSLQDKILMKIGQ